MIEVNYRFAPDKTPAVAEAQVRAVLDGFPVAVTDVAAGARPGLDRPAAADFLAAMGGQASAKFGWTDVARFAALGIPASTSAPATRARRTPTTSSARRRTCTPAGTAWSAG